MMYPCEHRHYEDMAWTQTCACSPLRGGVHGIQHNNLLLLDPGIWGEVAVAELETHTIENIGGEAAILTLAKCEQS